MPLPLRREAGAVDGGQWDRLPVSRKEPRPPAFPLEPQGKAALPAPPSRSFGCTWLIPGGSCQHAWGHGPMSRAHTEPLQPDSPQPGPPPTHPGTYARSQSRLCSLPWPNHPVGRARHSGSPLFPPINALLCSASTWQRDARSLPASPPFMLPSHRATVQ